MSKACRSLLQSGDIKDPNEIKKYFAEVEKLGPDLNSDQRKEWDALVEEVEQIIAEFTNSPR